MEENKFADGIMLDEELAKVSGGARDGECIMYTTVRGDTYAKIAHRYGTSAELIKRINNMQGEAPNAGQILWVCVNVK